MVFDHHVRTEVVAEVTIKMADSLYALKLRQQIAQKFSKLSTKLHGVTSLILKSTLIIPVLCVSGSSKGKIILVYAMRV